MRRFLATTLFVASALLAVTTAHAADMVIFAAASLTDVLEDLRQAYKAPDGQHIVISFASSSTLARQVESGAGACLFISADEVWMDYLAKRELIVPGSRVDLLGNQLVIVTPVTSSLTITVDRSLSADTLLGPSANGARLAVGDPDHVPAGIYAKEALTSLGLWAQFATRLAPAESVRAALALVERGEAPAGIVYSTDAKSDPKVRVAGTFPENSHSPIVYPMALLKGQDSPEARAFYAYLMSAPAKQVFARYGFSVR